MQRILSKLRVTTYVDPVGIMLTLAKNVLGRDCMRQSYKTIDEYIKTFPENVREILQKIRQTIHKVAPVAQETISYQMPTFKLNGNLVYFGAFKNHIGFFPIPSGIRAFEKESAAYIKGKGTLQFPLDKPIPYDLIEKIVAFRVQENLDKKRLREKTGLKLRVK